MKDYLFTACLNPQAVTNPYTHERMSVPCGHCKACMLHKSSRLTLLARLEALCHDRTYFVTLTYEDLYLPKGVLVPLGDPDTYLFVDQETGEVVIDSLVVPPEDLERLSWKLKGDYIPYLCKYDIQLFLKRLRKHYEKYGIKIRYHVVGEYGPKHFRPHYHLLLWFENAHYLPTLSTIIREKWPFGRTDCQVAKSDAARYVSGYANSFGFVPPVLAETETAPFCTHSQKLGFAYLQKTCTEVLLMDYDSFISGSYKSNGELKEFDLWRSAYSWYFPRCVGYADKSSHECLDALRIYEKVANISDSIIDIAKWIFNCIYNHNCSGHDFRSSEALFYFMHEYPLLTNKYEYQNYSSYKEFEDSYVTRIYTQLLTSRHFLELCRSVDYSRFYDYDPNYMTPESYYFRKIEQFYDTRSYRMLVRDYELQAQYVKEYSPDDLKLMYDPDLMSDRVKETTAYKRWRQATLKRFNDSIKHKKQNDINNVLFNNG